MYMKKLSAIGIVLASCCFFSDSSAQKVYRITAAGEADTSLSVVKSEIGALSSDNTVEQDMAVVNVTSPILDKYSESAKKHLVQDLQNLKTALRKETNETIKKLKILQANNYDSETISDALQKINFVSDHTNDALANIPTEYNELLDYCATNHKLFVCMCGMISIANEFIEQAKLASRDIEKELKSHKSVIGKIKSKLKRNHKDQDDNQSIRKKISIAFKAKLQTIKNSIDKAITEMSKQGEKLKNKIHKDAKPATIKTKNLVNKIVKNSRAILSKELANTIADNKTNLLSEMQNSYGDVVNIEDISNDAIKNILLNILNAKITNLHRSNRDKISADLDKVIENSIAHL